MRHVTDNALRFLRDEVDGVDLRLACDPSTKAPRGTLTVDAVVFGRPERLPTCPKCRVLWDAAMEQHVK